MLPFNPAKMFEGRRIQAFESKETVFYYYPTGHGNEGKVRKVPRKFRAGSHAHAAQAWAGMIKMCNQFEATLTQRFKMK